MIVYKWVYKKEDKYYSLMNYGYCRMNNNIKTNQLPYEIGKIYSDISESETVKDQYFYFYNTIPKFIKKGFYFWIKNIPIFKVQKAHMIKLGADINAILKCEVKEKDILSFERGKVCIRAKKFKVLEEII